VHQHHEETRDYADVVDEDDTFVVLHYLG
jgi:hypothetical protein